MLCHYNQCDIYHHGLRPPPWLPLQSEDQIHHCSTLVGPVRTPEENWRRQHIPEVRHRGHTDPLLLVSIIAIENSRVVGGIPFVPYYTPTGRIDPIFHVQGHRHAKFAGTTPLVNRILDQTSNQFNGTNG